MSKVLLVAAGSAIGGVLRYLLPLLLKAPKGFPWATLSINVVGSLLIGFLSGVLARHFAGSATGEGLRAFVLVGFCGGFTTFSTFSNETFHLLENGQGWAAAAYAATSVAAGLFAVALGCGMARLG